MLRKGEINLRKAKKLDMYALIFDLSTARTKWRQTPVTAYICLYQELNLTRNAAMRRKPGFQRFNQVFL